MPVNAKVASAYVDFVARMTEFHKALQDANVEVKNFARQTRQSSEEARASIALLGDEIGVRLPRHLRSFVAELPGVGMALSAAFNGVAVIGLALVIVEATKKLAEFVQKNEEAGRKSAEAWASALTPIRTNNDELELTKTRLENAIAKLEHRPQNAMKEAIAEARVEADKLNESLKQAIDKIATALKGEQAGMFGQSILHKDAGVDAGKIAEDVQLKLSQSSIGEYKSPTNTTDKTAQQLEILGDAVEKTTAKLHHAEQIADELAKNSVGHTHVDQSNAQNNVRSLTNLLAGLQGMQQNAQSSIMVGALSGERDQLTVGKDALQEKLKAIEDEYKDETLLRAKNLQEQEDYWAKYLNTFKFGTDEWRAVADKWTAAYNALQADMFKSVMMFQKEPVPTRLDDTLFQHQAGNSTTLTYGDSTKPDEAYSRQQKAALDEYEEQQKERMNQYANWLTTATGGLTNTLNELSQSFTDLGHMVSDTLVRSLDDFNSTVASVLSGDKHASFSNVGSAMFKSISKDALQYGEGTLMKAAGFGSKHGKADGYHMWLDNLPGGGVGSTSSTSSGILGMLNNSNWAGSLFGGKLFGPGGLFYGGGHASGGAVMGGMSYTVGEFGPETFVAPSNGGIVPHNAGGSPMVVHVDARGATDPAATQANAARGISAAIHGADAKRRDEQRRTPPSRRN
jgi:hypothetical protein